MKFERLVELAADLHCFSPGILTAGENIDQVRVQLSRWVKSGRVVRIHKGWYTLNHPFRRALLDMNIVASTIKQGAYVSLQSALAYHGMIPEYVPETTCVTTGRPLIIDSPVGRMRYRHIKNIAFFGYSQDDRGIQPAFIAKPEKALLDLLYLTSGSANAEYLSELRLQGTEDLDRKMLAYIATRFESPKLERMIDMLDRSVDQVHGSATS
jgi:predicted transcriptional regulator of viral defense system